MNKILQFSLMVAVIAAVGLASTAIMTPTTVHAAPRYCYNNGQGDKGCFTSQEQCFKAADNDAQCKNNKS